MRTLVINEYVRGTHPAQYRRRELSHTRIADVKKAATLAKSHLNAGHENTARTYYAWITDALDIRRVTT